MPVPKIRDEDRQFAVRLGHVLRELRLAAGWTQEEAADRLGFPLTTLGRWERGENAPKGYDLGRLFRGYEHVGAEWSWFFDPPERTVSDPVRDALREVDGLARRAGEKAQRDQEESGEGRDPEGGGGPFDGRGMS